MYILIENNTVITGPRPWNYRVFKSALQEELGVNYELPLEKTDDAPVEIADGVRILKATTTQQPYDSLIEYLHGPFWDFSTGIAVGTYQIMPKDITSVKNELKNRLASNRYDRETAGVKHTIQGMQVTIDTRRGDRDIFLQKLMMMGDNDTVSWKFPEGWLTISKAELGSIVAAGAQHVQNQFAWESQVSSEIDACTTLQELTQIDIGDFKGLPPGATRN
jgi:hypothetical protein